KKAQQETDYLQHVVFSDNAGFLAIYSALKDALLTKTGVITWWWDAKKGESREEFTGQDAMTVAFLKAQGAQIEDLKVSDGYDEANAQSDPTYDFTVVKPGGRVCLKAVPPEDFTVARDTVFLSEATYCAMRSRPRVQDLIADGMDAEKVRALPMWGADNDGVTAQARDTVAEQRQGTAGGVGDLRQVEIVIHFARIGQGDRLQLWRVVTGAEETILLDKAKVNAIPFGAGTPYIVAHRFYGESVADKLLEIQRIKTALTRMFLDSGYFALNQRMVVDETKMGAFTLSDLMRNEPNMPIRVRGEGGVEPIRGPGLAFDAPGALEYFSTVAEGRTGIVRNAQGLNPNTLHDTATGALALMSAAQKRVRLIARILAETLLKDTYIGIHAMLRENATQAATVRLRGQWVPIDPTEWGSRSDMTIQVGLGAAGREHDIAAIQAIMPAFEQIVTAQQGLNGPVVTASNIYALMLRWLEKLGFKGAEQYVTDPGEQQQPQQPQPNPEVIKAQGQLQIESGKARAQALNDQMKAQSDHELAQQKLANELQLSRERNQAEIALEERQMLAELALKREQLMMEAKLRGVEIALDAQTDRIANKGKVNTPDVDTGVGEVEFGG